MSYGHPVFDTRFANEVNRRLDVERRAVEGLTDDYISRLQRQARLAPYLSPRTLMNTARFDASDETVLLMNNAARENALKTNETNKVLDFGRKFVNPVFNAIGDALSTTKDVSYGGIKAASRYLTAAGESGYSFANNYLLERGISDAEFASRLGRVFAAPALLFFDQEMQRAAKYTELGKLIRDGSRQGSGFFLPAQLQYEQMLEVMGISPDGEPVDYAGRKYFDDAYVKAPIPELYGRPQLMKQPATIGAFITAVPRNIRPDGAITSYKGLDPDSGLGSFLSGTIDGFLELALDPTILGAEAVGAIKGVAKGLRVAGRVSPERVAAVEAKTTIGKYLALGKTANDLPSTSKSWSEIAEARRSYSEDVASIRRARASKSITAKEAQDLIDLRDRVLTNAETDIWNKDALSEAIRTDARFQDMFSLLDSSRVVTDVDQRAWVIRNKIFRNEISLEDARKLAQQDSFDGYRQVFLEAADGLGRGESVLPEKISDFGGRTRRLLSKASAGRIAPDFDRYVLPPGLSWGRVAPGMAPATTAARYAGKVGLDLSTFRWAKDRFRQMFRVSPQVEIMINGSAGQRADAVDNFYSWISNLLPDTTDQLYIQKMMGRVQAAMTNNPRTIERVRRGRVVTETISGEASRAGIKAVEEMTYEVLGKYMKKIGIDPQQARDLIRQIKNVRQTSRTYAIQAGLPTDYGQLQRLSADGLVDLREIADDIAKSTGMPVSTADLQIIGPAAIQEAYNHVLTLPDWRMLKSMVEGADGGLGRLVRNPQTGKLTLGANAVDFVVNDFWKPLTLANLGYFVRNILEGNLRMYMASPDDAASLFHRPFSYWKMIKNKAGVQDIMGRYMTQDQLDTLAKSTFESLTSAEKNLVSVTTASSWGYSSAFLDSLTNMVKTGQVDMINKASIGAYRTAASDAIRKMNADPLEALLARVRHLPVDTQVDVAMEYLYKSDNGAHVQNRFLEMVQDYGLTVGIGQKIGSYPLGAQTLTKLDLTNRTQRQAFFRGLIETQLRGRVEQFSRVPELRPLIGQNAVPKLGPGNRAVVTTERVNKAFLKNVEKWAWGDKPIAENMIGGIFYNPGTRQAFYIDDVTRSGAKGRAVTAKLIELEIVDTDLIKNRDFDFMTGWTPRREGFSREMENVVEQMLESTDPNVIGAFPEILPSFTRVAKDVTGLRNQWRSFIDGIFSGVMGKGVNALEKLPAYRQFKWSIYEDYYDSLSGTAINDAIRDIRQRAKDIGMSPDDYMGGVKGRFDALLERGKQTNALKEGYSLEQMDSFASSLAEKRMRNLFYDMPQKLNLETSFGVASLFQFIAATRTIMTDMARLSVANPDKVYRIARAINGTMELDLPGDTERGVVYTHPVTGKYVFRHPLGFAARGLVNLFSEAETGDTVTPILESQVQGLNIGLVGVPQANPLGQLGIGKVLDLAQSFSGDNATGIQELRKTLLPFESLQAEKTLTEKLMPAWMYKTINGINATAFGSRSDAIKREISDAASALALTGNYDLNDGNELARLEKDAATLGLTMYLMGAATTFAGPASANPDYIVKLDDIDVHMGSLASELQKMRDLDPDAAPLRWIDTFGDEAIIFLAGKVKMSKDARGILYTPDYLAWLKQNQSVVDRYDGAVAHFFGPQEDVSEYEFGVRSYLLQGGKARYAGVSERVLAAQYVAGSAQYRYIRNRLPTFLNDEQQAQLKAVRQDLNERYRGFTAVKYSTETFETNIKSIRLILEEGAFPDSELVQPLTQYMAYRDAFLAELGKMGLSSFRSKRAVLFRTQLESIGEELSRQNKSFQRLYDNLLSSETNPAGTD